MKKLLTAKFSIILLVLGLIFLFIGLTFFLWNDLNFSISNKINSNKIGQFGDFVGGLIGSIWALAGVIMFYVALTEQRKDFQNNRKVLITQTESLQQQIKEFELQRIELSEMRKVFEIQKFETSFFNLLKFFNDTTNSLTVTTIKTKTVSGKKEKETFIFSGNRFFTKAKKFIEYHLYEIDNVAIIDKQKEVEYIINYFSKKHKLDRKCLTQIKEIYEEKKMLYKQKIAFLIFYDGYKASLEQYMNLLITILRFIDKSDKKIIDFETNDYVGILKANLSELEIKTAWIYLHTFKLEESLELMHKYQLIPNQIHPFEPKDWNF